MNRKPVKIKTCSHSEQLCAHIKPSVSLEEETVNVDDERRCFVVFALQMEISGARTP
jgi:hypothetical protein